MGTYRELEVFDGDGSPINVIGWVVKTPVKAFWIFADGKPGYAFTKRALEKMLEAYNEVFVNGESGCGEDCPCKKKDSALLSLGS